MPVTARTLCLASVSLVCGLALAQTPQPQPNPGEPPTQTTNPAATTPTFPRADGGPMDTTAIDTRMSDKAFLKKAAEGNMTQVELGKLAEEKGSNPAVKEFGKRMVEDHTKANEELNTAAGKVNVQIPTEVPKSGQKTRDKLAKLSGPDFDRAYAKLMVNDHKENVQTFTDEARMGREPEVKTFAAKTLPTLQEHQKMAENMRTSVSSK